MNDDSTVCLSWRNIWLAIFLFNIAQLVFESALYFALETSLKPTILDKLEKEDLEYEID